MNHPEPVEGCKTVHMVRQACLPDRQAHHEGGAVAVRELFNTIAPQYDRFNALASLRLDHRWRQRLVDSLPEGAEVLDIGTGTGELALRAAQRARRVVGLDFSPAMLKLAQQKDEERKVTWILASADQMPFPEGSFDVVTSAFMLRSLWVAGGLWDRSLAEMIRVLRPGGWMFHLDFGRPRSRLPRLGHWIHLRWGVPIIGRWLFGSGGPTAYLRETISGFFEPLRMEYVLREAGLEEVSAEPLLYGALVLYRARTRHA